MATDTFVVSDSGKATITKDPNAILDYTFDWTAWLDLVSDALSSQTCAVENFADAGGVVNSSQIVGKKVVVWVSGGTVGKKITLRCRIVTVGNRTEDRTVYLSVKER